MTSSSSSEPRLATALEPSGEREGAAPEPPVSISPKKVARGTTAIERELCKGCGFCIEFCPARALDFDKAFNAKGYHPPRLSRPEACVGCNLCGLYCPDFAIFGYPLPPRDLDSAERSAPADQENEADRSPEDPEESR
ncbi:MAG: ferredoxin family protein [Myxococcales bacterium]|jgi:2-oxoglutarate ferredoxin oxidoreductase subunit delta|nr:ferredoxin family protein [Myxococcales bacterium]